MQQPGKYALDEADSLSIKLEEHKARALTEIHILSNTSIQVRYTQDGAEEVGSTVVIPLNQILYSYEFDTFGITETLYVVFAFVGILGIFAAVVIYNWWVNLSCPFIYSASGSYYSFEGELFSGAVAPNMERSDYLPLHQIRPHNGQYELILANELIEEHFIDQATLQVVHHPEGTKVLLDETGHPRLITTLQEPVAATATGGMEITGAIGHSDGLVYSFNHPDSAFNSAVFQFKKPASARTANLWLQAKNTPWMENMMLENLEKFGGFYPAFHQKVSERPVDSLVQWTRNQGISLAVCVETENGWTPADYLSPAGPFAMRNMVLHIDISQVKGDVLRIKLVSGFNFWELDYVAIDYTPDQELEIREFTPLSAWGSDGVDYADVLSAADKDYLYFLGPDNHARVIYPAPAIPEGMEQSVFLHGRGYYQILREFNGLPEFGIGRKMKQPGYLPTYSKDRHSKLPALR